MKNTPALDAMIGKKFGRLTVISKLWKHYTRSGKQTNHWKVICKCDCGSYHVSVASKIKKGQCQSCGCLAREMSAERLTANPLATKHGMWGHPLSVQWQAMMNRCNNPKAHNYEHYGGKGIAVCDEWSTLDGYINSVPERPSPKHTLHRIDNSKGYCPENCEWVSHSEHMKLHWKERASK